MGLLYVAFQRAHHAAIDARRRASTAGYLGWSMLASLTLCLALVSLVVVAAEIWMVGLWLLSLALVMLCTVPALGPWLLRHVIVPRGWVKLAYHCGRFSVVAGTDAPAYGLVAAAWACAGARRPVRGEAIAWLQDKRDARGILGDAEVVTTALLLVRGDVEAARQLLASVRELVELHPAVRELAGEWLAVDAAERGAWSELLPDVRGASPGANPKTGSITGSKTGSITGSWPATPLRFFLEGVAARQLGHASAPTLLGMWARWLMSPGRRHTWELMQRAPGAEPVDANDVAKDDANDDGSSTESGQGGEARESGEAGDAPAANDNAASPTLSLEQAIALHVALHLSPARGGSEPSAAGLQRLATRWDAAFSAPETTAWLARRALELGAPPGAAERAAGEIMETVASELRATIERQRLPSPPRLRSRFGQLLGSKLRHGRLDELELQFTRWADRVVDGTKLRPVDEWREFLAVRQSYRDVVESAGDDLRRLAFPHMFHAANRAAVALWNHRDEHAMAHAILAWELEEARAVGDVAAIELSAKNAALKFTTRTGPSGG
jgi:hypothetical protein